MELEFSVDDVKATRKYHYQNLPASRRGVRQIKGPVNVYFKTLDELQDMCSTKVLPITFNADKAFNR